jgi:acyl-CoA oxidase
MPDRTLLLSTPELRPFLPMLYVAWADGRLDPNDEAAVRAHVASQPWLKPAARIALEAWLDGAHPPSPSELSRVRRVLTETAGTLAPAARSSLVALGSALAAGSRPSADTTRALNELEGVLGASEDAVALDLAPQTEHEIENPFEHASFDPRAMQKLLDGKNADVRANVRAFLDDPSRRAPYGLPKERHRAMVNGWLAELSARGFGALGYPKVTTDRADLGGFMAAFETLAMGDLSLLVKYGVQFGLFGGSIYFLGTERHHRLLADVASLKLPGCFAMSEVGHGSNVADLETTATYDHATGEIVIHTPREAARKDWIGGAAETAQLATVFAALEVGGEKHGIHAFLVPVRDPKGELLPGVRAGDAGHKMGLNGVDNGRLWFDHVRIPRDSMLNRFASITAEGTYESEISSPGKRFFAMLGTLVGGRVSVASGAVTASKVALAIAIRYATRRRQFGATHAPETLLLSYPTHQRRLLPALATAYAHSFALEALRDEYIATPSGSDTRALEAHAAGLKADTDVFTTFEGDNTVLLQLVARNLLGAYSARFTRGGVRALAEMLAERATVVVRQKNPLTTRLTDVAHLRDRNFQRAAFAYRASTLLGEAARRMKKRIDAGADPQAVLLDVQEHLVALAEADVEARVMNAFANAVGGADDALRPELSRLCDLHALSTLEARAAWFVEDGYFEPPKIRAIRKLVPVLFAEIAPSARALVDAFGIPDACLAAPIAFGDPATM